MQKYQHKPKLIVFDLDFTLWECGGLWVDTCAGPPFKLRENPRFISSSSSKNSIKKKLPQSPSLQELSTLSTDKEWEVVDRQGSRCGVYDDVPEILSELIQKTDCKVAFASRTHEPEWARELLKLLGLDQYAFVEEIYPGSKLKHFKNFTTKTGFQFQDMLFFDDEMRNIKEVGNDLGITSIHVSEGLHWNDLHQGLFQFNNSKKSK
eukprot:gb/GECH01002656.1/.p1 GENE.gb/GECH01002656.1/~~gb/GECH01002656.1/.p1  ORF type:complete len:207 (+),score=70.36 gb/GECH01002656.1/:1-621(+)